MNHYRMRMARSIANRLAAVATGRGAMFGVELGLRDDCEALTLDVAGAVRTVEGHHPAVRLADGSVIDDDRERPDTWETIAAAMDRWMAHGRVPASIARALPVAAGGRQVTAAAGMDPDRMAALAYAFRAATLGSGGAEVTFRASGGRMHVTYARGRLRWEDGLVTMPSKPLPQMIRLALRGRPLGDLVNDPAIAGRTIALVLDGDPRERTLRVHTTDIDRFVNA